MKEHILPAIKLTLVCLIFFCGIYTMTVLGIAQFSEGKGMGNRITSGDKIYYANVGQSFTRDDYFWSRPSAVNYNAAASGGSNKGPSNADYLLQVQARIDTFLVHNPEIDKSQIPSDLVTASGAGLDPNISLQAARIQVPRIAKTRNMDEKKLYSIIDDLMEKPLFGFLGTEKINVLKLNLAIDNLK